MRKRKSITQSFLRRQRNNDVYRSKNREGFVPCSLSTVAVACCNIRKPAPAPAWNDSKAYVKRRQFGLRIRASLLLVQCFRYRNLVACIDSDATSYSSKLILRYTTEHWETFLSLWCSFCKRGFYNVAYVAGFDIRFLQNLFHQSSSTRMEKMSSPDRVKRRSITWSRGGKILHNTKRKKATWICYILRKNCFLKHVTEGKM
jgi:hypothetical protein